MSHTECTAKTPPRRIGFFATLRALLHGQGSSTPQSDADVQAAAMRVVSAAVGRLTGATVLLLVIAAALTVSPALAKEAHLFQGTVGAAELTEPTAVAGDNSTGGSKGDLYVADPKAGDVRRFDSSGSPANFSALGSNSLGPFSTFGFPTGLAVDSSTGANAGDLYVATQGKVRAFKPSGEPAPFSASASYISGNEITGTPSGSFGFANAVAVDSNGDIYVLPGQEPYAVDIYAPSGEYLTQLPLASNPEELAVGPTGDLYLSSSPNGQSEVVKYSPTSFPVTASTVYGPPTTVLSIGITGFSEEFQGLAVGSANDLYVNSLYRTANVPRRIIEFNEAGDQVSEFGNLGNFFEPGRLTESHGVAAAGSGSSEKVYTTERVSSKREVDVFGPLVTIPDATTGAATEVTNTAAKVSGTVNPDETEASYQFEYGTSGNYAVNGQKAPASPAAVGNNNIDHPESVELEGLEPSTTYHFRVDGINSSGTDPGQDATFRTTGPPTIVESSVAPSGAAATVEAKVNPSGFDTALEVEYGTSESYGSHSESVDIGSSSEDQEASVGLSGLQPETTYHYRVVATNHCNLAEPAEPCVVKSGEDKTFKTTAPLLVDSTTFSGVTATEATLHAQINPEGGTGTTYRFEYGPTESYGSQTASTGIGSSLKDQEASAQLSGLQPETTYHFRVVAGDSFTEAHGGPVVGPDRAFFTYPSAVSGPDTCLNAGLREENDSRTLPDCRAYEQVSPPGNAEVYVPFGPGQAIEDIESERPYRASADGGSVAYVGEPSNSSGSGSGAQGYAAGDQYLATRDESGWAASDIQPLAGAISETGYQAFSADLSLGVVYANGFQGHPALTEDAPYPCGVLYSRAGTQGAYHALFTETQTPKECGKPVFAGASIDNSRLFFQTEAELIPGTLKATGEGDDLYDSTAGHLSLVNLLPNTDKQAPEATFGGPSSTIDTEGRETADFSNVISTDGSRAFWTNLATGKVYVRENIGSPEPETVQVSAGQAQYWTATPDGRYAYYTEGEKLFRFDVQEGTREALAGSSAKVQGVIGVNETGEDGAYLYFVAEGVLAANQNGNEEEAVSGEPNLYLLHAGATTFIATLSPEDDNLKVAGTGVTTVSGDWRTNLGSRTAELAPDGSHLLFQSTQPLTGYGNGVSHEVEAFVYDAGAAQLSCVSCNPSGGPPTVLTEDSGRLPFSTSSTSMRRWINAAATKIFFDTPQPLLPTDTNAKQDVYEWERAGAGSCAHGSPVNGGGCLYLLSGGRGTDNSFLLDASASGSDAFIVSRSQLVPIPQAEKSDPFKLYDAREKGGFHTLQGPPCEAEACKGPGTQEPQSSSPGTSTFSGPGNEPEKPRCKKGFVKKRGNCVKPHHKKRHHKRAARNHGGHK